MQRPGASAWLSAPRFAGLSKQDEATVRAWLAGLAAMTTPLGHADANRKEKQ